MDDVFIPMSDGAQLAATIWLPEDAAADPVPVLLEYLPYRRGDWTATQQRVEQSLAAIGQALGQAARQYADVELANARMFTS